MRGKAFKIWPRVGHDRDGAGRQSQRMVEIRITMETTHPPTGRVVTGEGAPVQAFVGWLQLLTILANALQPAVEPIMRSSASAPSDRGER